MYFRKQKKRFFGYNLHSDWPSGKDKRNIAELKKRLSIAMIGIKVKNVHHIQSNKYL